MLAALALCTTIGGVYAAWVYPTNTVPSGYGVSSLDITGVDYEGQAGSISVVGTNTGIMIDDLDTKDYKPEFKYDSTGYFTVTFTPAVDAMETVKDGMDIEWHVGLSNGTSPVAANECLYTFGGESKQIFSTINSTAVKVTVSNMTPVDSNSDDVTDYYTFTISMADVVSKLTLNETIILSTEDRYNAYYNALTGKVIHVHAEVVSGT